MIQVVYKNGKEDIVEQKFLDILLHIGEVQEFRRSDHWVNVTEDPIRSYKESHYEGENRRLHNGIVLPPSIRMCR
jgi:hypothetical protein